MATMMKSLWRYWLNGESSLDGMETGVSQFGAGEQSERSDDSNIEDCETVSERRDSASPWVHGLL